MVPRLCDVPQTHHCIKSSFSKTWTYLLGTFWHPSSQDISSMGSGLITPGLLLNQSTFACYPHPRHLDQGTSDSVWRQSVVVITGEGKCYWPRRLLLHILPHTGEPPPYPRQRHIKHKRQWCQGWENLHQDNSDPSLKSYRELGPCSQHRRFL